MEAPLKEMLDVYKDSMVWSLEMGLAFQFRKKLGTLFAAACSKVLLVHVLRDHLFW